MSETLIILLYYCMYYMYYTHGAGGDDPIRLQVGQGDTISGRISRREVGRAVAAALGSPYAAGKTFEIRRDEVRSLLFVVFCLHSFCCVASVWSPHVLL